jgi:hypothetical protein
MHMQMNPQLRGRVDQVDFFSLFFGQLQGGGGGMFQGEGQRYNTKNTGNKL